MRPACSASQPSVLCADTGDAPLQELSLVSLNLGRNMLGDVGMKALGRALKVSERCHRVSASPLTLALPLQQPESKLQVLEIHENRIARAGVKDLAAGLEVRTAAHAPARRSRGAHRRRKIPDSLR